MTAQTWLDYKHDVARRQNEHFEHYRMYSARLAAQNPGGQHPVLMPEFPRTTVLWWTRPEFVARCAAARQA